MLLILWIPRYFFTFLKLRTIFWVRKSSILANLFKINRNAYGLCACTYENTFRNIKSRRWSLWLVICEKTAGLLHNLKTLPEALPKKDNLYLVWFSCLIYSSWSRQICLLVWWAFLYVIIICLYTDNSFYCCQRFFFHFELFLLFYNILVPFIYFIEEEWQNKILFHWSLKYCISGVFRVLQNLRKWGNCVVFLICDSHFLRFYKFLL